jgi:cytochrome c oxidase cbb3-type subunit 4
MEWDYETIRHFAGSWGLVYLIALFVLVVAFTFRPGSKEQADKMAQLPLDEDENHVN